MSSSSRSPSPYLANSSDSTRSTPDKEETPSEPDERGDEFGRKVAASPPITITPPEACEQDDAILVAALSKSPLQQLMERTGCGIIQVNGQRRYGPPNSWNGPPPPRGSEVFVGKIPRDCFEDELIPIFERVGFIYEMRLMMEYTGQNRGYAFVVYSKPSEVKECIKTLNNYEIRKGRYLGVCMSVDNCRLFVGGIPKRAQKDEVITEISKVTEGVVDVIMYPSASDKTKNRGFAFIEYECHRAAAMARRKLMSGGIQLWGHQIAVDWAEPEIEPDEEVMSQVKVLYVRNLMLTTSEQLIQEAFCYHAPVERVKKIRDYAFVHFETRDGALKALRALNGSMLDGSLVEVSLAKPVDRDTYQKSPRFCRVVSPYQSWGYIPLEYAHYAAAAAMMWGASSYLPATTVRPAMTSAGSRAFSCRTPPRAQFYPPYPSATTTAAAMTPSPTRYYSPPTASYYRPPTAMMYPPQYGGNPSKQRKGRGKYDDCSQMMLPDSTTLTPPNSLPMKKSSVQLLDDVCTKNGWGAPSYSLHSTSTGGGLAHSDLQLFLYHIRIPAMGVTFQPTKLSPSVDEAQRIAAEYCLVQLGYPGVDCYSSHATPTSSPVRLAHQPTATPNTFSAVPNCFITGAVTSSTPTSNKLFPWQHEPPHQTTAGLYAAYELTHHQPTSAGCMSAHGEMYPTF